MATDNKFESLKILIESLKLYFAYSSSLLLASVAFIASTTKQFPPTIIFSVICLLLAAVLAIVNINYFIRLVKDQNYDIDAKSPRLLNSICITLFALGTLAVLKYFLIDHSTLMNEISNKNQAEAINVKDGVGTIKIEIGQSGAIKRIVIE